MSTALESSFTVVHRELNNEFKGYYEKQVELGEEPSEPPIESFDDHDVWVANLTQTIIVS